MKAVAATLGFFILSVFVCNDSMAQKATYTSRGGWTIGIGGGTSYQKSDLANSKGFGLDFTVGSQIYRKENSFLSIDWKFRFLAGQNKAFDHRINPDDTYSNIRYSFFTYDLELGLTLNRLRERTRIVLSGFAGAGLTHGRTFTDLYDAGSNPYDFSSIDPNRDSKLVYADLVALSDGNFETSLVNKVSLLPTAGIFVGYQISRSITLGVEFKTNFYLTEDNSLVGIDLDNSVMDGSGMDRNNYVTLGLGWNLGGGSSYTRSTGNYSSHGTNNYVNTTVSRTQVVSVSSPRPTVHITEPSADRYQTASPNQIIRATIENVSGPEGISFSRNGFPVNIFTYNVNTKSFVANVTLRDGENSFSIKATNQVATAEDMVIITLDHLPEPVIPAPAVAFTSPSGNRYTSSRDRVDVTASVKNISKKEDIQLTLNGMDIPFEYYPYSGLVKISIIRNNEDNNLLIKGFNEAGSAQDQLAIRFESPEIVVHPSVRFTNPPYPVEVNNNRFPLSARTQNVSGPNEVFLTINGVSIDNFSFSNNGEVSAGLLLAEGVNTIEITARNEAGMASDKTSIAYHEPVYYTPTPTPPPTPTPTIRSYPPSIQIISPQTHPFRTYEPTEEVRATVLRVDSKENITLNINGLSTRNFSYNSSTKELFARVSLREGENVLTILAQNRSGEDAKDQVFIKEIREEIREEIRPCPAPVIRLIEPARGQIRTNQQSYAVRANVRNITNSRQLSLSLNGKAVPFSFENNIMHSTVPLVSGSNSLSVNAVNECGEDHATARITYNPSVVSEPCNTPSVSFDIIEVNRQDATHELRGSVSEVKNKTDISLTVNGRADNGFQFVPSTGDLNAKFKLTPGSHSIVVTATNACGTDTKSGSVTIEEKEEIKEEACGIRINPGNSAWQFCLVTPSGTFTRDNLTNPNFSYSGTASSLYFMPIGGGGNATVNGQPYTVRSGQYYLFTGSLHVTVSTKNPGAMGQWSVCISASRAPASGNGNNRPKSPCEEDTAENVNKNKPNNNTNNSGNRNTNTRTSGKTNTRRGR